MLFRRAAVVLALLIPLAGAPEAARAAVCTAPTPSTTQPGYLVADPDCDVDGTPFTALPGARVHTGVVAGAAYRIEVPRRWNGGLVVFAHGYRGTGTTVYVDDPGLRRHYVDRGYAWAASSYATNGYDVGQGVRDSVALIDVFRRVTGARARQVIMSGASMGGHVTAVAIEEHPRSFAGAMPYCGVLGDTELFDYFLDANVTAAALTGVDIEFPLQPDAGYQERWRAQAKTIVAGLKGTPAGATWSNVLERRSGGERPGFDSAFAYWNAAPSLPPLNDLPFLFGLYPGLQGGTAGIAPGNVTDNRHTFYRSTDRLWPTAEERRLNRDVLRVRRTASADPHLSGVPRVDGRPPVPVLSLHDIGDLFVPFSMEQVYAAEAAHNRKSHLFVSRAIRGVGHCDFTQAELTEGFDDLTTWLRTGHRPAGDAILDRRAVAAPTFGCRFTRGTHVGFVAPPC
ncbi:prolyl oligopeptidase family serine peptidase [Actinoplanes sp. NPDC049596]|uniref:alpha/beta hydrolase family protein n=1 Tax=unclassified Actinoplanes TaxID=2626549 RepID=UPI0034384F91